MNYLLISCCLPALVLFAFMRPQWRHIGPSLLDSFVIGLCLFALGSILVWIEGLAESESVMRMAISTALSGILGASLWSYLLASRVARLKFFADAKQFSADANEHFTITVGFAISTLVSLILLVAVFFHPHIRTLLLDAFLLGADGLNEARIAISSGTDGYFAPGYVKQFRDIIVPILCVAAILCDGTYRYRSLVYVAIIVAVATTVISGQRLVIIQYALCLGTAFLIDRFSSRPKFASLVVVGSLLLVLVGAVGLMSKMLGRLDVALSPMVQQQKEQLRRDLIKAEEKKREAVLRRIETLEEKLATVSTSSPQAVVQTTRKELENSESEAASIGQKIAKVKQGELPREVPETLLSNGVPVPVVSVIALAHRAVIAVPRENTINYLAWSAGAGTPGAGWTADLSAIRPGTQKQLSSELSGGVGDSPLGLATDVYYNWGWLGVMMVPALFALFFLWLDVALTATSSPLTSAAKIFMFFTIPLMYSPFMFILYGGFVVVGILCYVWLLRNGALSFLGLRPQSRQSPR
jgi:hypothetical protein